MKKTNKNLLLLYMVFGVCLVVANVVTGKLIDTHVLLFGATVTLPGAIPCYMLTFLVTDIIGEVWGKEEANLCVKWGFIVQVLATLLIILVQYLPAADQSMQIAYTMLLGQNWVFVIGSLVAYFISQNWDVLIFHKLRDRYVKKHGSAKHRWIWNNASTLTSQILDTVIFIGISFGFGFGWFFDKAMWPTLGAMMLGQYLIKAILALLDTPIFYLCTRNSDR